MEDYHRRAKDQSYIDYGFHLILTKPNETILTQELPKLAAEGGISSVKLYMTYPGKKLGDGQMLDIMMAARELGITTMIHAENSDMIDLVTKRLLGNQKTSPYYHALARPQIAESEATHRAIALATLTSTPILIVHMSTPVALSHARKAQTKSLLPIHAETCPHYMYLTSQQLASTHNIYQDARGHVHSDEDEWAGAKHICAPPLRHDEADLQAVWDAVNNGTITVISSDHAPTRYDDVVSGKQKPVAAAKAKGDGSKPTFAATPNGLPGIETRLPLLFHAATRRDPERPERRMGLEKFVAVTATSAARLYGLGGRKGVIAPGYDADITIWYPEGDERGRTRITNGMLHHAIDYTPFEGMEVCNWPRKTLLRGRLVWDRDVEIREGHGKGLLGGAGDGQWLSRGKGGVLVGRVGQPPDGMKVGEREAWGLKV